MKDFLSYKILKLKIKNNKNIVFERKIFFYNLIIIDDIDNL